MSQTIELPRTTGPGGGVGGIWRVVVLNDDFNTFDHVAESLSRIVPGVTLADGYRLADRIHHQGLRSSGVVRARTPRATGSRSTTPGSRWRRSKGRRSWSSGAGNCAVRASAAPPSSFAA